MRTVPSSLAEANLSPAGITNAREVIGFSCAFHSRSGFWIASDFPADALSKIVDQMRIVPSAPAANSWVPFLLRAIAFNGVPVVTTLRGDPSATFHALQARSSDAA